MGPGRTMSVGGWICLLQVCMVVLTLLLVAGDVERNPGPTEEEDQVKKVLPTVDDSLLAEDDHFRLLSELMPAVASWKAIGEGLHLRIGTLEEIETEYNRIPRECMSVVLKHWLRRNYNVEKFGVPTWQTVVKVVAHSAAGNNCALALRIAGKHSDLDNQDGTTHDPVNDDRTPPAKRRRTKNELRETSPFSSEEKVLPVDEATLAKEQAATQISEQTQTRSQENSCASSLVTDDTLTSEGASVNPRPSSSSQSENSQKARFWCGCGKCTLSSFIESGCPNPNPLGKTFPYLDTSGLTNEQKQNLQVRLLVESRKIMLKFELVKSVAMRSLIRRGVTVDELLSHLTIVGIHGPIKEEPLSPNCYTDLMNATTIPKVFIELSNNYISFFNYDVLELIVEALGTEEDKQELQKYKDNFRLYAERRVCECLPQLGPVSEKGHADIFVKIDLNYNSYTVQELQVFKSRFKGILGISSEGVLRLCQVEEGCFQLMFQVPSCVQQKIFPLSSEQKKALIAEKVIKLTCEDYEFVAKGEENESEPEDTYSPSVSDHFPPPSFSQQLPLSYLTSTTPLPCTQESSHSNITIYAPETELTQQSLVARQKQYGGGRDDTTSQGDAIIKIDETILLGKKSPKPPTAGGASTDVTAKGEAPDAVSDIGYGIDDRHFPPAEVRSKLDKKPLLTSTQKLGESSPLSKSHLGLKEPPTQCGQHSLESIVDDSQPDSEVPTNTVLPGLRKPTVTSLAGNCSEVHVAAPFSVETNHSLPETDPSVLVPSSLTPRSQEKPFPDSGLISTIFKGKRRKRELIHDDNSQESQRESKRSRYVDSDHKRERVATSKTADKSASWSTPRTPKKKPREDHSSTSPFLSTRKHRKVEAGILGPPTNEDDANAITNTAALGCGTDAAALTDNPATLSCTQHTQNMSKLATGTGLVTPFTCLIFAVGVVCNDDIWNDNIWNNDSGDGTMLGRGGGEGEDPLGFQEPPRKNYKPVCTEDGFILARSKPKLQASRLRRLGLLSSGSGSYGDMHGEGEENSAPTAVVDINFVSLVARRGRGKGGGDGVSEKEEEEEAQTAVKNFKKFRKVRHTDGGIPRILSLVQFVPSANQELQDWDVRGVDEHITRTEESSQDLFQFTIPSKRKRTVA